MTFCCRTCGFTVTPTVASMARSAASSPAQRCDIAYNGMAGWDFDDGNATPQRQRHTGTSTTPPSSGADAIRSIRPGAHLLLRPEHRRIRRRCRHACRDGLYRQHRPLELQLQHAGRTRSRSRRYRQSVHSPSPTPSPTATAEPPSNGAPMKIPPSSPNNVAIANCKRMSRRSLDSPPHTTLTWPTFCRAGDALPFNFRQAEQPSSQTTPSSLTHPPPSIIDCWDPSCSNSTLTFMNNIVLGYDNPKPTAWEESPAAPADFYFQKPIGHISEATISSTG